MASVDHPYKLNCSGIHSQSLMQTQSVSDSLGICDSAAPCVSSAYAIIVRLFVGTDGLGMWIRLVAHFTMKGIYQEICSRNVAQPIVMSIITFPHQVHPGGPFCSHLQLWGKLQSKVFFVVLHCHSFLIIGYSQNLLIYFQAHWLFLYEICSLNSQ